MKLAKGMLRALVALLATLALVVTAVYYKVDESGIWGFWGTDHHNHCLFAHYSCGTVVQSC